MRRSSDKVAHEASCGWPESESGCGVLVRTSIGVSFRGTTDVTVGLLDVEDEVGSGYVVSEVVCVLKLYRCVKYASARVEQPSFRILKSHPCRTEDFQLIPE